MDKVLLHKKYRDDGIIILSGTVTALLDFYEIANEVHPFLKFTFYIYESKVLYLDLDIFKGERFTKLNILDLQTHFKLNETFQY